MKEYIRSKIIKTLEIIVLIPVILLTLSKESNIDTSFSSAVNDNIGKTVGQSTIQVSQNMLYQKSRYFGYWR